jgi:hypothetical protein
MDKSYVSYVAFCQIVGVNPMPYAQWAALSRLEILRGIMRSELQTALNAAKELPAPELPELIGSLAELQAICMARLAAPVPSSRRPEELLDVQEASRRLGVSTQYLYKNHANLPFSRRIGRKLLFSSTGIDDHFRSRKRRK